MCVIRRGVSTAIMGARQATVHEVTEGSRLLRGEASRLSPSGRHLRFERFNVVVCCQECHDKLEREANEQLDG